ncbi:MAG: hypothetical protein WB239_06895 [Acidimicrobiia bacterium]
MLLPSASEFGPAWSEALFVGYGPDEGLLGTASGGENLELGPDYGAQAPDGIWWFLDAAKRRLAHYSETGDYLGAVEMPSAYLAQGQYFQHQLPHVLDDGTLVAQRMSSDSTTLLLLEGSDLSTVGTSVGFTLKFDDGKWLYGFANQPNEGDVRVPARVDPHSGTVETVDWFETRAGSRFSLEVQGDHLMLALPDAPAAPAYDLRLAYAGDPSVSAYGSVEVTSAEDGTLFFYIVGGTDSGVGGQLAGFVSVAADGEISAVEPTPDPFTPADPGSPAHLGIRPGTSVPWIMIVGADGVHVFRRG